MLKTWGSNMDDGCSLREAAARATLSDVHREGHVYIEIRKDGRRPIFFCILCPARCYSDSALLDHLQGSLHRKRYEVAKHTLLGPLPWPFSDGIFFFHPTNSEELHQHNQDSISQVKDLTHESGHTSNGECIGSLNGECTGRNPHSSMCKVAESGDSNLMIPDVLLGNEISTLKVEPIGSGKIEFMIDELKCSVQKVWCAWLGKEIFTPSNSKTLPLCDFGLVVFPYHYDLGRKPVANDLSMLESCTSFRRMSSSNKNIPSTFNDVDHLGDIAEKVSSLENYFTKIMESQKFDNCQNISKFISNRVIRKALRKQQRLAAERICDICQEKMLPGKDVAALYNRKAGNLACRSRNFNGVNAFHAFHVSCLIRWILFCEYKIWNASHDSQKTMNGTMDNSAKRKKRRRTKQNDHRYKDTDVVSILCPECQGTGVRIEEQQLEKPSIPLSEMYMFKIKANEAQKEWVRAPEILENCSLGLCFIPRESYQMSCLMQSNQEKVLQVKLIQFYRANYEGDYISDHSF